MTENMEKIKKDILGIVSSSNSLETKLENLNQLLGSLNPLENTEEIFLVCDACILCAEKLDKTEMIAQLCLLKGKAEISKTSFLIKEMKELTLALGWFAPALKSEKNRYEELDKVVKEIWANTQKYIDTAFFYLNKNPYIGPAGYCQKMAGEIYGSFYLQLRLYYLGSGKPWKSKIANYKIIRFLNIDDVLLLDKKSRTRTKDVRRTCLRCFKESIKYYKQDKAWSFLADCYLSLCLEYHSFNSPIRSKITLYKAVRVIKKYKVKSLDNRLESMKKLPLFGGSGERN